MTYLMIACSIYLYIATLGVNIRIMPLIERSGGHSRSEQPGGRAGRGGVDAGGAQCPPRVPGPDADLPRTAVRRVLGEYVDHYNASAAPGTGAKPARRSCASALIAVLVAKLDVQMS
jgi:hypothetical protein